ncbi:MAG: TIGR04222 domain-containing membrane protein [Pirellulaceae bacterium]|nr:TIGR04222 domain-containing membrane protein [Pirellulaceae bacterium]
MNDMLLASHPSPDNHTDLWSQLELFQLDVPTHGLVFSERLARENAWSPSYTRRAIAEYKRFLYLAMTSSHVVCPSDAVDQVWHMHSTDSYQFAPGSADAIGPIDVAWMQGGPARAIDCALVELAQKDAITIEGDRIGAGKNLAKTRADHRVSELVLGSVRSSSIARQYSAICRDALVGIDGVRQNLVDKGLVLDRSQRTAAIAFPIALHGGLLAFAVAKAVVGVGRGKPIGFLLVAIVATIVVMVLFTVTVPKVTSAGKRLLAKLEKQVRLNPSKLVAENQSDANTIDNSAMLWSTAFLGAAALSTGPWTYWRTFLDNQHRSSSTSSGGCSTTGCGGDSGGGGCGGGGCGGCGGD